MSLKNKSCKEKKVIKTKSSLETHRQIFGSSTPMIRAETVVLLILNILRCTPKMVDCLIIRRLTVVGRDKEISFVVDRKREPFKHGIINSL